MRITCARGQAVCLVDKHVYVLFCPVIDHVELDVMLTNFRFEQPYIEQAARDKSRAEQEKSEYDVRTMDRCCVAP